MTPDRVPSRLLVPFPVTHQSRRELLGRVDLARGTQGFTRGCRGVRQRRTRTGVDGDRLVYVQCAYERWRWLSMPREIAEQRAARQSRINLRASNRQEQLLRHAAAATDRTVTDFVLESAVVEAERVLADRRWFLIDDAQWDEFQRLLEQPARELPKLRALLADPAPFAGEQ